MPPQMLNLPTVEHLINSQTPHIIVEHLIALVLRTRSSPSHIFASDLYEICCQSVSDTIFTSSIVITFLHGIFPRWKAFLRKQLLTYKMNFLERLTQENYSRNSSTRDYTVWIFKVDFKNEEVDLFVRNYGYKKIKQCEDCFNKVFQVSS